MRVTVCNHFRPHILWRAWIALLLLGTTLRVGMLAQDVRFHPDEALYATYARRMSLHGDLLLADVPLDKPPLGLALTAFSFSIFGPTEFAARLPAYFASLLTLVVFYTIARRLYDDRIALIALGLLVLSPFDLAFAATVFHDPLLTLWLLLVCLFASQDRWRLAGICAACAIATKQSAIQFIPIFVAVGAARSLPARFWRSLRRFVIPIIMGGLLLAAWSAARAAPVDFWTLGVTNPGQMRLIRSDEVLPRLERWLDMLGSVTGWAPLLLLAVVPLVARPPVSRAALIDTVLAIGVLATLLAYWLLAFNTYDRYLHSLGPPILLLAARGMVLLGERLPIPARRALLLLVVGCMLPFTLSTLQGHGTVGGDLGVHTGIDGLAAQLKTLPAQSVVYDSWLGWELGYYLGDQPPVRIIFQPTPEAFARAVCQSALPSYFVAPSSRSARWIGLARAGGAQIDQLRDGPFELYRLDCSF
jgi:4-amino-4-deoxy-L-arabinose transferase-like glycosyltransferase